MFPHWGGSGLYPTRQNRQNRQNPSRGLCGLCIPQLAGFVDFVAAKAKVCGGSGVGVLNTARVTSEPLNLPPLLRGVVLIRQWRLGLRETSASGGCRNFLFIPHWGLGLSLAGSSPLWFGHRSILDSLTEAARDGGNGWALHRLRWPYQLHQRGVGVDRDWS